MNDRHKFRIPMFTDKGHFIEYQYVALGDIIEVMLCGYNGEPEQCTGLTDKNGKLIYEGDVVKTVTGAIGEVVWMNCGFMVNFPAGYCCPVCVTQEVIGNIHE